MAHHSAASNRRFSPSRLTPKPVFVSNAFDLLQNVSPSKPRRHKTKRRRHHHQRRHMNTAEEKSVSTSLIGWTTVGLKKKRWHRPLRPELIPVLPLFNEFSVLRPGTNDHKVSWSPTAVAALPEDIMPSPTHRLSPVMRLCILWFLMMNTLAL